MCQLLRPSCHPRRLPSCYQDLPNFPGELSSSLHFPLKAHTFVLLLSSTFPLVFSNLLGCCGCFRMLSTFFSYLPVRLCFFDICHKKSRTSLSDGEAFFSVSCACAGNSFNIFLVAHRSFAHQAVQTAPCGTCWIVPQNVRHCSSYKHLIVPC